MFFMSKITKRSGTKMIVDASGEALKAAAKEGVFLSKPSIGELSTFVNKAYIAKEEIESIARALVHQHA